MLDDLDASHSRFRELDVRLEPERLRPLAAFFSLANWGCALGSHILNSIRPTPPHEAGAVVAKNWMLMPLHHGRDMADLNALIALLNRQQIHYKG